MTGKQQIRLLVLNGPNLNMLGVREPHLYGEATLADLEKLCQKTAQDLGAEVECRQSNHEGELVDWIQQTREGFDGILINGGAYTHTSVAIHDALKLVEKPIIEVHISNLYMREEFRQFSYISPVAVGVICGLGIDGYAYGLQKLISLLKSPHRK